MDKQKANPASPMGLTAAQAAERAAKGLDNKPVKIGFKSSGQIVLENTVTYFNIIFCVLAALVCMVGEYRNLTFLPIVIINTVVGIYQEIRARNVLKKLTLLNAPVSTVVRDGKEKRIPSEQLVQGDTVLFKAGDQIPADGVVVSGSVRVNEALLTGEADEVEKTEGAQLMSGSFVVSGQCTAQTTRVGKRSYISQLTLQAKADRKKEVSRMMEAINRLILVMGILIIPIGGLLFYQSYAVNRIGVRASVVAMVAAVIGMIPEGLYLLTTVALAVSTMRLAEAKVLLHDMKSIESLARVDVLCVDKTGTITENTMEVSKALTPAGEPISEELEAVLSDFVAAMPTDNITMEAMQARFTRPAGEKPSRVIPFSSQYKYCGETFRENAYVLGAPEMLLGKIGEDEQNLLNTGAEQGYRVLTFGRCQDTPDGKPLQGKFTPLAFLFLSNAIRKNAPETFAYFEKQGVSIKVISGDNARTVSRVAQQAGIAGSEKYVDAATLTTQQQLEQAAEECTVFGRVTPKQKQLLVKALQAQGHTVAMTGDGVNDILAMKDADCSVAMASGSDAAAQAAQIVLLESDFSRMPEVVLEGRRVVNNIQRSASLFLVKNIFSLLMALFSVSLALTYPLEPAQISLISGFNIGIPAFFLAMEPNKKRIEGSFLRNVLLNALPAGLTDVLAVAALVTCGRLFGLEQRDLATAATLLLAFVGFMIMEEISRPMNRFRWMVLVGSAAGLLFCGYFFDHLFALQSMTPVCLLLFTIHAFAAESVYRLMKRLFEWVRTRNGLGSLPRAD